MRVLYGSRGGNGVILVTTKGGKEGKVKIVEDIFAEKISAEFVGLLRLIVEKEIGRAHV